MIRILIAALCAPLILFGAAGMICMRVLSNAGESE